MSNRREIEDKYTVICEECNAHWINPDKQPAQKYGLCPDCIKRSECSHEVNMHSLTFARYDPSEDCDGYIDVFINCKCKHCGQVGSTMVGIPAEDISWE